MYEKDKIRLLFAGDFKPPSVTNNIYSSSLLDVLKKKDFSIVNLEAPVTIHNKAVAKNGNNFKLPGTSINHILTGFFDAVALSNNHIRDFGCKGVNDTINICAQNKILTVGAGSNSKKAAEPLRAEIKRKTISFLNFSEEEFNAATDSQAGANPFNIISVYHQIKAEKETSDFVFIIYHGGIEYQHLPTVDVVEAFKFLIDTGADGVIAHHTHRYSGTMVYKNKPILFGLGNFLTSTKNKNTEDWRAGLLGSIIIEDKKISYSLFPTIMDNNFLLVTLSEGDEKSKILNHVKELSEIINDEEKLNDYWVKQYSNYEKNIIDLLKSNSRLEYRLRKKFPFVFSSGFSNYKLLNLLNLIRCPSHRNKVLSVLSKHYEALNHR